MTNETLIGAAMNYWIFKSEPEEYGIDRLALENKQVTCWNGIRSYQARNNLRDEVKRGDLVLFYHSSCKHIGIAESMKVVKAAYANPAQCLRRNCPDHSWPW